MDIDAEWIALNLAYIVYVASPLFKEILKFRVVLVFASVLFIIYGLISGITSVTVWNITFGLVSLWHISVLIRQRLSVNLTDEAEAIRVLLTPELEPADFSQLWNSGRQVTVQDNAFIIENTPVADVSLILDGLVSITNSSGLDRPLGRFAFLGEQSALMGRPATATVTAVGPVRLWSWEQENLKKLLEANPSIRQSWTSAIAADLVKKVMPSGK